ncbi:MAG: hypothetical protein ACTXOO_03600 [Sodalis sp. (in: enterobacteria)]
MWQSNDLQFWRHAERYTGIKLLFLFFIITSIGMAIGNSQSMSAAASTDVQALNLNRDTSIRCVTQASGEALAASLKTG